MRVERTAICACAALRPSTSLAIWRTRRGNSRVIKDTRHYRTTADGDQPRAGAIDAPAARRYHAREGRPVLMAPRAPLVSIQVPCYRQLVQARRCVDTILSQSFTDFELTLVDDGASDEYQEFAR